MVDQYLVYGLIDPRTEKIRYIGQSHSGLRRPRQHAYGSSLAKDVNKHKVNWIRQLLAEKMMYRVTALSSLPECTGLDELEQYWIAYGWMAGWPLLNVSNGGLNCRYGKLTEEHKEKLSVALRGKPKTAVHCQRVSAALTGVHRGPLSAEHRAKVSASLRGRPVSKETRAKIGEKVGRALRGRVLSAEMRAKISAGGKGLRKSSAHRIKLAESVRLSWIKRKEV